MSTGRRLAPGLSIDTLLTFPRFVEISKAHAALEGRGEAGNLSLSFRGPWHLADWRPGTAQALTWRTMLLCKHSLECHLSLHLVG